MSDFYHITIKPNAGVTYEQIEKQMNLAKDWVHYADYSWIVYTTSDAAKWYGRLESLINPNGRLLICKLDLSDRQGWLGKTVWEWIRKKRT